MLHKKTKSPLLLLFGLLGLAIIMLSWANKPILQSGYWRATIERPDGQLIVFNFLTNDSLNKTVLYVINGSEHMLVDSVVKVQDSIFIELPFFESSFKARLEPNGNLKGEWIKKSGGIVVLKLPFHAVYNLKERFPVSASPVANISGRWTSHFVSKNNKRTSIVAEFVQSGSHLTGTFLDPTGDYRFLQGVVNGDSLYLSGFDGGHAFLFKAKIDNKNKISGGTFYSGARGFEEWSAVRDEKAKVPDGYGATSVKKGAGNLDFSFQNSDDGKLVSIKDPAYKGKVVVIQILGSWCPNCMDETKFLSDYYTKNRNKGFEVIGLSYERTTDFNSSQKALEPFKKRFEVTYPILITGVTVSDTLRTEKTLPQLQKISAFPTTIFVDKKGAIRKIHSGFNGPATGVHYDEYKKEFDEIVTKLLAE